VDVTDLKLCPIARFDINWFASRCGLQLFKISFSETLFYIIREKVLGKNKYKIVCDGKAADEETFYWDGSRKSATLLDGFQAWPAYLGISPESSMKVKRSRRWKVVAAENIGQYL
jgi:hypothetical protein